MEQNEKTGDQRNIDEIILATDPWSDQCMNEVANSTAISDTILQLDSYLEDELIPLEQYLKQISKLAREQFTKLAIAKKVKTLQHDAIQHKQQQHDAINTENLKSCAICSDMAMLQCSQCKEAFYCSTEHQIKDWNDKHSKHCKSPMNDASNKQEKESCTQQ